VVGRRCSPIEGATNVACEDAITDDTTETRCFRSFQLDVDGLAA